MFNFSKIKEEIWVNIDIPTKTLTLHQNCVYIDKMKESNFKGIGTIKRDGGWIKKNRLKEIRILHEEKYPDYTMKSHCLSNNQSNNLFNSKH